MDNEIRICPNCGEKSLKSIKIDRFDTKVKGVAFTVSNALIKECDECGEKVFSYKEVRRWEEDFKEDLLKKDGLLSAEQIRDLRKSLKLDIKEFAQLFAVTQLNVHAWESKTINSLSLGPAALLLALLKEDIQNDSGNNVFAALLLAAKKRGQLTDKEVPVK